MRPWNVETSESNKWGLNSMASLSLSFLIQGMEQYTYIIWLSNEKKRDNCRPKAWDMAPGLEPGHSSSQLPFPPLEEMFFLISVPFTVSIECLVHRQGNEEHLPLTCSHLNNTSGWKTGKESQHRCISWLLDGLIRASFSLSSAVFLFLTVSQHKGNPRNQDTGMWISGWADHSSPDIIQPLLSIINARA